jgi:hypothetical protein
MLSDTAEALTRMDEEWVQVRNCNWLHDAHFIVSVLDAEGIEALVPDAYTIGARPDLTAALGGIRVLVRASELERAREVLAAAITDLPRSDVENDD